MDELADDHSIDSEEEARKYDYGLYLLKRLVQIKRAEVNRKRLDMLLRAFYRWSYEFPLAQKCDELAKQLRERSLMMDTVRSSYLRDVVSIKYQLDKINDAEVDSENLSLVKLKQNMYDLHTLPSVDLRELVENVRQSVKQTSAQLRETLVDAGLLDPETLRTLNPWDQSRGFRRLMRIKKGGSYKPPDLEGESMTLAAPTNKKLYVRYCKDCIGLTMFIKGWNKEVEDSLKFKADFANVDSHIQEFRSLIDKLNGTIESQERKIVELLAYSAKLETANAWFEKWGASKAGPSGGRGGGIDLDGDLRLKHMSEMARAELESFAFNSSLRVEEKHRVFVEAEQLHLEQLRIAEANKEADSREKMEILCEFRKAQNELSSRINEIKHLHIQAEAKEEEQIALQHKLNASETENTKLHEIVDRKELEYAALRDDTNYKLEDLSFQIKQLNSDYNNQESTIDDLRDAVMNKTMELNDRNAELVDLKERIHDLELLIPPPKPRFTLRVVAIAIRYLIRLTHTLAKKDYASIGKLGYTEVIRRQEKFIKMLNNANEKQMNRLRILEESYGFQAAELESFKMVLLDKIDQLKDHAELKRQLRQTERRLRDVEEERNDLIALSETTYEQQNIIINQRIIGALDVQHTHHLKQAKVYAQIQRNLGHHLAQSIFQMRTVISSLDIDTDMVTLMKPYEPSPLASFATPDESSRGPMITVPALRQPKWKELYTAMKARSLLLVSWIKKNRGRAILLPKRVPVVLFRQSPNRENMSGDDKEFFKRDRNKSLSVMTHVIQHDFEHVEAVRRQADADMRKVQDYVHALKSRHNELIQTIKDLEEELREERMPNQSQRMPRKRIGDIKASYSHLMRSVDQDHQNSYFSNVLKAIDMVQQEHGEIFKEKLIKSGKFKLTELVKTVVRRNSLKGIELFQGTDPALLDPALPSLAPPSRSSSSNIHSGKLVRLNSVTEHQHLETIQSTSREINASSSEDVDGGAGVDTQKVAIWELSSKYSPKRKTRSVKYDPNSGLPLKREVSFPGRESEHMRNSAYVAPGSTQLSIMQMIDLNHQEDAPDQHYSHNASTASGYSMSSAERSFGYVGDLVVKPVSPPPPHHALQGSDTVGFETDSDEEGEGMLQQRSMDEMDDDEDVIYMVDLLAAKNEMVGLLSREEEIQNIIKQAEVDKLYLEGQVKSLALQLEQKQLEFTELQYKIVAATGEQKQLQVEFDALAHQNELLREIVEEDYRYHTATMERAVKETEEKEKGKVRYVKPESANISTQVSCAVCAIREEGLQHMHPVASNGYDDATIAMAKESFTRALNGEVVLIAQPRKINAQKKSLRAPQDPPRGPLVSAFEDLHGSLMSSKQAPGSYLESDLDPRPDSRQDSRFDSSPGGFSNLLMKHLDTNPYNGFSSGNQTSPTGRGKSANGHRSSPGTMNGALNPATTAEVSKFSRIKKMPFKGSASNSELLGGGSAIGKMGIPPRPHSALATTLKKKTESHTAAYLQNQLMNDCTAQPQVAPAHSDPHVPLRTLGMTSGRPESTAEYLAYASKQRASSAGVARIEHTNSASLLHTHESHSRHNGSKGSHSSSGSSLLSHNHKLQLEVRLNDVTRGLEKDRDYIADITDEMSDAGMDEFV